MKLILFIRPEQSVLNNILRVVGPVDIVDCVNDAQSIVDHVNQDDPSYNIENAATDITQLLTRYTESVVTYGCPWHSSIHTKIIRRLAANTPARRNTIHWMFHRPNGLGFHIEMF